MSPIAAAVAAAQSAPAHADHSADDCKPKKKTAAKFNKRDGDDDQGKVPDDEDQNLSQQVDNCVFPVTGEAAAPAEQVTPVADGAVGGGGGISSGLLIGAGILAAAGIGALVLGGGDKNRAPTASPDTGAVNEGASLTGSVATNDSDPDNDPLTFAVVGTAPAGFTLNPNGSFTFDAANAAYNSLAAGQTQQVVINYSVSDGEGGSAASTLTITVTGTNDAPVAVADTGPASTEGGAAVTGSVATNDSDPDQNAVLTYTLNAPVAGLTLNSNGTYSFDPANTAYNELAAGQTRTVVANYTVTDGQGATSTSTLTFVVTGVNDAPVAAPDTNAGTEGAAAPLTGSVATNDTDPDSGAVLTYTLNAPVAGLTLNSNGTYSFDLADPAYNDIPAGVVRNVVANYTVTDAQGATSTSTLTIAITGTNDAPVAGNEAATATEDGAVVTGSLTGNDIDPDAGTVLTYSLNAPVAGLTVNPDGTFSFDPGNAAYNGLGAGETQLVNANITVSDGQGGTAASVLAITVTGINDAPVAVDDTASGNEDAVITGTVATNDADVEGDALTFSLVGTAPAGFVLNADGSFSLDARNAAYQDLSEGESRDVTVTYQVDDGNGGTDTGTLTVTVRGINDAPVAVDGAGQGNEDAVIAGTVAANDAEGDTLTFTLVGSAPAGVVLNADGSFTLDARNAAYQDLGVGETRDVTINFQVDDGNGGTDTGAFVVTVTGINDAPVAVDDTNAGLEDTVIAGTVANDTDLDGDTLTFQLVGTAPAGFVLNADGSYSLDTRIAAYQNLRAGEILNVVVDYQVSDGQGGTDTGQLTIEVTGQVETINLDIDDDNNPNTVRIFDAGATDFAFTDSDDVENNVVIINFGADDTITFDAPFNGPDSPSFSSDGTDVQITTNVGGALSQILIQDVVDASDIIFDEVTADREVAGADNFRTTTQSAPVGETAVNLDQDNDTSLNTFRVFDAGTGSFTFNDDANLDNSVVIINLGADDRIVLDAAEMINYSFGTDDIDGDGNFTDLVVTGNVSGTLTQIVIKDAVSPNAIVFDEESAEIALGRIDYFSFA